MITSDDVREGLARKEFFLQYLPIVSLADGRCVGAEALSRWRRGEDVVDPNDFIPAIEDTPVAGLLTYWVIEQAAEELGAWMVEKSEVHLAINVPPILLGRGGIEYAALKSGFGVLRQQLIVEITERGVPDRLGVAVLADAMRTGVHIALDDVTLSGSNLALLSRCAVDIIKIDRSLIAEITDDSPSPIWLENVSSLIKTTGLKIIAEGVENAIQFEVLCRAGIPMAQGYYLSPPLLAGGLKMFHAECDEGARAQLASGSSTTDDR